MAEIEEMAKSTVNPLSVVNGIVSGALGLIGQGMQQNFARQESEIQRSWNEEMMDKQNQWSLDMWNRTNEYNSPLEQRKRLEEAGLNPLFYGLDGSSANGLESAQALGYDRASLENMQNPLSSALSAMQTAKSLELQNAQIENVRSNTAKINNENLTETQRRENMKVELDKARQEIENLKSTRNLTDWQSKQVDSALRWLDRINEANIAYQDSVTKLNDTTRSRIEKLLEGELKLQDANLHNFEVQWQKVAEEIKKIASEIGLNEKELENFALVHAQSGLFGTGISIPNLLLGSLGKNDKGKGNPSELSGDITYPDLGTK